MRSSSLRYMEIDNAGLDDGSAILNVDRENSIHSLKLDDDSAFDSARAPAQPGAGAAGQEWDAVFISEPDNLCNLIGSLREHHHVWAILEKRQTIALVNEKLGVVLNNASSIQRLSQLVDDFVLHGFFCFCSL